MGGGNLNGCGQRIAEGAHCPKSIPRTPPLKKRAEKTKNAHTINHPNQQVKSLMLFSGNPRNNMPAGLPFKLTDYLELVELTGRVIRNDKRGHIESNIPSILHRLGIEPES